MSCNRQRWKQDGKEKTMMAMMVDLRSSKDQQNHFRELDQFPCESRGLMKKLPNSMRQKHVGYI